MSEQGSSQEVLRYRDAAARRGTLVEIVNRSGFCTVADLSDRLGVSRMTVRRDIQQLEQDQKVRGAHGGVAALLPQGGGTHIQFRSLEQSDAKQAVAEEAVALVQGQADATVGFDAGTSAFEVARRLYPQESLRVVTHSLLVMNELSGRPNIEVVGVGGVLHPETQAFAGPGTILALERYRLETLLLTTSSINEGVMYCGNAFDADTKRELMRIAERIVLLADSSKLRKISPFDVNPVSAVDLVIVDDGVTEEELDSLKATGVETIVAPLPPSENGDAVVG
jgi:DeoR/GlpR family transcriptional regulator of sugar metabolism